MVDDRNVSGGLVFSDADLLPFVVAAEARLGRILTDAGAKIMYNETTPTVTAGTTSLDWASSPALPDDFVFPLRLWEKAVGDPDAQYMEMDQTTEHVPLADQTTTLRFWGWYGSGTNGTPCLKFTGATTDRVVKIMYYRQIPALTGASDALHIPNSKDAMAADVLRQCHDATGEGALAQAAEERFQSHVDELKRLYVRGGQRRPRRKAAYGFRPTTRY